MGTVIRAEISKDNEYYIDKHRYYELKHYCMQYDTWKQLLNSINLYPSQNQEERVSGSREIYPILKTLEARMYYLYRIGMLERVAVKADPVIGPCVLKGVITDTSYEALRTQMDIPCCKDVYYTIYRKFFWLLDKARH